MKLAPFVVVLAVLALAGCSAAPAPKPSPTAVKVSTVTELRDAFVKAGGECPSWAETDRVTLAAQSGDCSSNTVLSTYLSASNRDEAVATLKSFGGDVSLLVGENWIINTPHPERYSKDLAGTVVKATADAG